VCVCVCVIRLTSDPVANRPVRSNCVRGRILSSSIVVEQSLFGRHRSSPFVNRCVAQNTIKQLKLIAPVDPKYIYII